jgi:hypothetical protein
MAIKKIIDSLFNNPIENKLLTCQPNEPIPIVELRVETTQPAFSNQVQAKQFNNLKSDIPELLFINTPNQTKVKALLQQQKHNNIKDSS